MVLCLNCDGPVDDGANFCSPLCVQTAKTIRYGRAVYADGRIELPDVAEALRIKLASVLGGGYPEAERRVSSARRAAVFTRDGGICQLCHDAPATQVDHLDGSSDDLENLRGVCDSCHRGRTLASVRAATPAEVLIGIGIRARIDAASPLRACDDHETWAGTWRSLQRDRRRQARGGE